MKKVSFLAGLLLACSSAFGQLPEPFNALPQQEVNTGYFLPISGGLTTPHNGSSADPLSEGMLKSTFHAMHKADLSGNQLPSLSQLFHQAKSMKATSSTIPIVVMDLFYDNLHPDAYANGWVENQDGQLVDLTDEQISPFITDRAFAFFIDWNNYLPGDYTLVLNNSGIISNTGSEFDLIEFDFDDGLGFRTITPGAPFQVSYASSEVTRHVRLRGTKGDDELLCTYLLKGMGCANGIGSPDPSPWPVEDENNPHRISTTFNGETVFGNAYVLNGNDGVFDKPFLFIEGIDFGTELSELRNGTFGWYEFTCGGGEDYPFLSMMPEMLNALLEQGYDLVLLDFADGADHIEKNSELLIHLINLVNEHKEGDEELIVSGASMGGQISRIALRKMELAETPHCTRLWISLDSPHRGANVPYGLQTTLSFLAQFNAEAEVFVEQFLKRPAARELLLLQLPSSGSLYAGYQAYIDELGYPEDVRSIAIANGNLNGQGLPFNDGVHLLDYSCSLGSIDFFKLLIISTGGDPFNSNSTPANNVISHNVYSQVQNCSGFFDCLSGPVFVMNSWEVWNYLPVNAPRLDNAPGGTRNSLVTFVESMNETLAAMEEEGDFPSFCNPVIESWEYEAYHSFIPTTSALGINTTWYHMNVAQEVMGNPSLIPFDRYYAVPQGNTIHSEITPDIIALVLEEVMGGEFSVSGTLNASGGQPQTFNLAGQTDITLYSTEVSDGAQLFINDLSPIGAGDDPLNLPNPNTHVDVRTSGCGAYIEVRDGGQMKIGDGSFGMTGRLVLRQGTALNIAEGGYLLIEDFSEVVVRSGATLTVDGGSIDLLNGARIVIEEGGILDYQGGEAIQLFGVQSSIDLYGQIVIAEGVVMDLVMAGDEGGKLRVLGNGITVAGGAGSELVIVGAGMHDTVLDILPGKALRTSFVFGALRLRDGRVNLLSDARITTTGAFMVRNIHFNGAPDCVGIRAFNSSMIRNCELNRVPVRCELQNATLRVQNSQLLRSPVQVLGGTYRAQDSEFIDCGIRSEDLQYNAHATKCTFTATASHQQPAIEDNSTVMIYFNRSEASGYTTGIKKSTGELRLRCSDVLNCSVGVIGGPFSVINSSSAYGGGYSTFIGNGQNIVLNNASKLWLINGFNTLGYTPLPGISGTLLGVCNDECGFEINATGNTWPNENQGPQSFMYDIFIIDPTCNDETANGLSGCSAELVDRRPGRSAECVASIPPAKRPTRNDFIGGNIVFDPEDLTPWQNLQEGLRNATLYTNNANVTQGIEHLTYLLNLDNDDLDPVLIEIQMAAFQQLVVSAEEVIRAATEQGSGLPTASLPLLGEIYNGLNKVSTGDIGAWNYHDRLFLEFGKSHVFDLLGQGDVALEIIQQAADCGLDPTGIASATERLHILLRRTARNAFNASNAGSDNEFVWQSPGYTFDAISTYADAVFGAHIDPSGTVEFPMCSLPGTNSGEEDAPAPTFNGFSLVPNPTNGIVNLQWNDEDTGLGMLHCYQVWGEVVFEFPIHFKPGDRRVLDLSNVAPGMYFISVVWNDNTLTRRVLVK